MPFKKGHTYGKKKSTAPALAQETIQSIIPSSPDLQEKIDEAKKSDRVWSARIPRPDIQDDMLQRYADIGGITKRLSLPKNIEEAYANAGWVLKWVRYIDPKSKLTDFSMLNKYFAMQGSIVSFKELETLDPQFAASKQRSNLTDMTGTGGVQSDAVTVGGDLILVRYPAVIDKKIREQAIIEAKHQRQEVIETAKSGDMIVSSGKINPNAYFE